MKNYIKSQKQTTEEKNASWVSSWADRNSKFKHFWDLVIDHKQDSPTSANSPRKGASVFLVEVDQLENRASSLINSELTKSGLIARIEAVNLEIKSLLNEIRFFPRNPAHFTFFLKSSFSAEEQEKWDKISSLLALVYDAKTGYLKAIQDHLLFQVGYRELASLLNRETISPEEELFLRGILIKGYLVNFYQLVLPFYSASDNVLVNFKKQKISYLEERRKSVFDEQALESLHNELTLLHQQINNLELNIQKTNRNGYDIRHEEIELSCEEFLARNVRIRDGSIVLEATQTIRYLDFLHHKRNINALEITSKFGFFRSSSYIAKCLPFLSVAVEAGTGLNNDNNNIIYSYEKQLKVAAIIDNLKSELLVLEQQVTNYYTTNYFKLRRKLTTDQQPIGKFPGGGGVSNEFLPTGEKQKTTSGEITEGAAQYQADASVIRRQNKIISTYREKIAQKQSLLNAKEQEVAEKDLLLVQLSAKFTEVKSPAPGQERTTGGEELPEKNAQLLSCWEMINNGKDSNRGENTRKKHKPREIREKPLEELQKENFHPSALLCLEATQQQEDERDIIIRTLVDKQDELRKQLQHNLSDNEKLVILTEINRLKARVFTLQWRLQRAAGQTSLVKAENARLWQARNDQHRQYQRSRNKYGKLLKKYHRIHRKYQKKKERNLSLITSDSEQEFRGQLSSEEEDQQSLNTEEREQQLVSIPGLASYSPPTAVSKTSLFIKLSIFVLPGFLTIVILAMLRKKRKRKTAATS